MLFTFSFCSPETEKCSVVSPAFSFSTDAKMWRKMLLLFTVSFPTDFFFSTNLQRFLDVYVIWRWVQICVCRRGRGESCWRNRSRKPFLLSRLHSLLGWGDPGGEGRPCSPAGRGNPGRSGRLCSAAEIPAAVTWGQALGYQCWWRWIIPLQALARLCQVFMWCHMPLSAVWSGLGQWN